MAHSTKLRTGRMCNPSECVTITFWWRVGPLMAGGFPEGQKDGRTGGDGSGSTGMMVQAALEQVPDGLARARRAQGAHEGVVAEGARHVLQGPQVVPGPVLR